MNTSILTKLIGFSATLIHGDTLVMDRWRWLKARLPLTRNHEKIIDIGCGSGAFSIGSALRGYDSLGLSWDERNQKKASTRASICKADSARFEVLDIRQLHSRDDLKEQYEIAICLEVIEHILDDRKLLIDISACLKPGGRLLLTTPYMLFRPVSSIDKGPFVHRETGGHVRRGYTKAMLDELCEQAGLVPDQFSYAGGILSQKITGIFRTLCKIHWSLGWFAILPLRWIPPLFDSSVTELTGSPHFSICLEAYKPRFKKTT